MISGLRKHRPDDPYILQPKPRRFPGRRKAMTIGIGFLCNDGVVLCSDRQITGPSGFKYEEGKIFSSQARDHQLIFSYAGVPDAAKVVFQGVTNSIPAIVSESNILSYIETSKAILAKAYGCKQSKGLQSFIGLRVKGFPPFLLKTYNDTIVEAFAGESIGVGDSSALRYLSQFLIPNDALSVADAQVLASYLVFVANRYIDGCSGGPDHRTINMDGSLTSGTGGIFPNEKDRFSHCEDQIGKAFRDMLFSGGTKTIVTR